MFPINGCAHGRDVSEWFDWRTKALLDKCCPIGHIRIQSYFKASSKQQTESVQQGEIM